RPEPGVPVRVVPHHAGRHDRPGRDDAPADDPRHQFGDHLLVAEPVLHADHGGAGQGRPRARDRGQRVQRLGGDQAEVARGQVTPVGAGADLGGEVRQPGDPQAAGPDRVHVLGPGVDGPYLDAGHTRQVRGVQAPDRAAADDGDADGRAVLVRADLVRAGHDASSAIRAIWSQTAGSPPPTPSPATTCPPSRTGSPPGTPSTGGTTSTASAATARPSGSPKRAPRSPLQQSNRAAAPATACATATPPAGAPSIRSCWIGSPPRSTTATATRIPRRDAASMAASHSPRAQSSWAWRPAGGAGAMPRLSAGSTVRSPKRCSQRFWSSPCCPVYGTPRA